MSAIGAGGGLAAMGLSAQGMGNGIRAESKAGPAAAKTSKEAGAKDQAKAKGGDFGRDGALSRGQGFSQRDAFAPAKQAQKPNAAQKPQQAQAPQKDQLKQQVNQQDQVKGAQQAQTRQVDMQTQLVQAMIQMRQEEEDELKLTLIQMWKKFFEWLKEMDQIFMQPAQ